MAFNFPDSSNMHPLNTTLQPIPEEEDRHKSINLVLVRQGEMEHEAGVTGGQQTSDQDGHQVFLSREKISGENKTHAYLDSGASAHMFKDKEVFVEVKGKQITLTTACDKNENKNIAQVGSTHTLKCQSGTAIERNSEAIYCKDLVENLVSVETVCDQGHTIVFDKNKSVISQCNVLKFFSDSFYTTQICVCTCLQKGP